MDINKEREAFEQLQNPKFFQRAVYLDNSNAYVVNDEYRDDLFSLEWVQEINYGWLMWQAAKATPEGFVLDAPARVGGGVFREGVKWKTVIESAQCLYEHSKDEIKPIVSPSDLLKIASGELVLVPRKATKKMIERGYEAHDCFFTLGSVRNVWDAMIEAQEQSHD